MSILKNKLGQVKPRLKRIVPYRLKNIVNMFLIYPYPTGVYSGYIRSKIFVEQNEEQK